MKKGISKWKNEISWKNLNSPRERINNKVLATCNVFTIFFFQSKS